MKVTLHVSADRLSKRKTEGLDEIAATLRALDVDAQVVVGPVGVAPDSDFWVVLEDDVESHLSSISDEERRRMTRRFVLLNPTRDVAMQLLTELDAAAIVGYIGSYGAWIAPPQSGFVVRRDIAKDLGGELGHGLPYGFATERYAAWQDAGYDTLARQVVAYLRAAHDRSSVA